MLEWQQLERDSGFQRFSVCSDLMLTGSDSMLRKSDRFRPLLMMLRVLQLCFVGKPLCFGVVLSVRHVCHICIDFFSTLIICTFSQSFAQLSKAVVLVSSGVVRLGGMHHRLHNAKKIKKLIFCCLFPARTCANMASRSSWTCVAPSGIPSSLCWRSYRNRFPAASTSPSSLNQTTSGRNRGPTLAAPSLSSRYGNALMFCLQGVVLMCV